MFNHRNGNWTNTETVVEEGIQHVTVATRDIRKGEQIYISYNMCEGCSGRTHEYGTGEIFRDYGFVEPLPQRFYYTDQDHFMVQFDVTVSEEDRLEILWDKEFGPPGDDKIGSHLFAGFLRRQIRRLRRLANILYRDGNPGMPENEWDMAWEFQRANLRAMTLALEDLGEPVDSPSNETGVNAPHYDPLGPESDDLAYSDETCDNEEELQHVHHQVVDFRETRYQELAFSINPANKDVVMELDTVTQIASVYRPQYHEYSVHAAARFVDSVKRVIFIGGGDSMLLHEILKYPELELVVGLELDQMVVRKSFRFFSTQPHFDDPRVEWWFGDATKSLLLLPEDYWQSFDLVLVDLSETVMSFSVTNELDVFDALALLLKPEGVLVKNEIYMDTLSKIFDYSVQLCYVSPVICDQVLTFGSSKVDFFHSPVKDHGIETLLYEPMVTQENRHNFLHDYQHNDARAQGKCDAAKEASETEHTRGAGIMEVIEAEEVQVPLDETIIPLLEKAIAASGFNSSRESVVDESLVIFPMKEGFVIIRMFSDKKYCNLDINVWGNFDKLKILSAALIDALGSDLVSNYRVVVGGMFGTATWQEDKKVIGPQIVQTRDCSSVEATTDEKPSVDDTAIVTSAIDNTLSTLLQPATDEAAIAVVVCGGKGVPCLSYNALSKSSLVSETIRLQSCAEVDAPASVMYHCESKVASELRDKLTESKKVNVLVMDSTASKEMFQILNSLLNDDIFRKVVISGRNVVLAWSAQPAEEGWRQEFLDRYRKQQKNDPVSHGRFEILSGSRMVELGVVCTGNKNAAFHFDQLEKTVERSLADTTVTLKNIHGGKYEYWNPWEPRRFLQSDYDDEPGLTQYYNQKPLAVHTLAQLESEDGYVPTLTDVKKALDYSMSTVEFTCTSTLEIDDIGDGCMLSCLNPDFGSIVLVWDGRTHIDIGYYTTEKGKTVQTDIESFYEAFRESMDFEMYIALRDDMPRGIGRVVNFPSDMRTSKERAKMYEHLEKRAEYEAAIKMKPKMYYEKTLGEAPKVEQGSCSNPDADESSCWPEPDLPPLEE